MRHRRRRLARNRKRLRNRRHIIAWSNDGGRYRVYRYPLPAYAWLKGPWPAESR